MKRAVFVVLCFAILISFTGCDADSDTYKQAGEAFAAGEYEQVIELMNTIREYDDVDNLRRRAKGILVSGEAQEAFDAGEYEKAAQLLRTIPEYADADVLWKQVDAAVEFQMAAGAVTEKNTKLDTAVDAAQKLLDAGRSPLDEETVANLKAAVANAREGRRDVPDMPQDTEEMLAETQKLEEPLDYSALLAALDENCLALEISVRQKDQVTNPTGGFIISRIGEIEDVGDIESATEKNDPNEGLYVQGGYVADIFFASPLVLEEVDGESILEKGTAAGGSIEVFKTILNAQRRDEQLATYDGKGMESAGSHVVCGTVVIRTSKHLTETQQAYLTNQIIEKLTELR